MQACSMKVALDMLRLTPGSPLVFKVKNCAIVRTHPSSLLLLSLPGMPPVHARWQLGSAPISVCHIRIEDSGDIQSSDSGSRLAVLTEDGSVWICTHGSGALQPSKKTKTTANKSGCDVTLESERRVQTWCEVGKAESCFTASRGTARVLLQDDADVLIAVEEMHLGGIAICLLEVSEIRLQVSRSLELPMGFDRCSCISLITCEQGKKQTKTPLCCLVCTTTCKEGFPNVMFTFPCACKSIGRRGADHEERHVRLPTKLFEALFGTACSNGVLILAGEIHRRLRFLDLSDMANEEQQQLRDVPLPALDEPIKHIVSVACEPASHVRSEVAQKATREGCCLAMAAESGAVLVAYMREQSMYWVSLKLPGKAPLRCMCATGNGIACVCSDGCFWVGLSHDDKGTPCFTVPQPLDLPRCVVRKVSTGWIYVLVCSIRKRFDLKMFWHFVPKALGACLSEP
jgi:hypothetical protein